jgi:tetratricopeptide (TPR) repeat protein
MLRGRVWIMRALLAVVIPAFLLGTVETMLRWADVGVSPSFFLARRLTDRAVWTDNPHYTRRFFGPGLERAPWPFVLPQTETSEVVRVVVLGESAAMGDPKPEFGLSRMLDVLLAGAYPGRRFEVLNAAVTAINSHAVRAIALEAARHQPDYFVVYMGNNEVIGPYGPGTIHQAFSGNRSYVRTSLALRGTRLGQYLQSLAGRLAGRKNLEWQGMEMFLDRKIAGDDPRLQDVYGHFARNLEDILAAARNTGATPVLSTVAVNLRDCAPFASQHSAGIDEASLSAWQEAYERGLAEERQERWTPALQAYEQAAALDPLFAETHFRQGRALEHLGRPTEAYAPYARALEADALRFRADARLNELIRQAGARDARTRLVDFDRLIRAASPQGLPGETFFVDHVHLNFAGNYRLARAVLDQMEPDLGPPAGTAPDEEVCRRRLAFTPWDQHAEADHMYQRLLRPPFSRQVYHEETMRALRDRLGLLRKALTAGTRATCVDMYRDALTERPGDWALRRQMGLLLLEQEGGAARALPEFQAVADALPHLDAPRYSCARVWAELGRLDEVWQVLRSIRTPTAERAHAIHQIGFELAQVRKWTAARSLFEETLRLDPNHAEAHSNLGLVLMHTGDQEEAIAHLQQALRLQPGNVKARTNLGTALARRGERAEAARALEQAAQLGPTDADAQFNWGVFLVEERRMDEARQAFEAAVRADPESADAHANLGLLMTRTYESEAARGHFETALLLDPTLTMPHGQLALMDLQAGSVTSAITHFESSVSSGDAELRSWFARRLIDAGLIREARDQFEAALAETNAAPLAANDLAWLLATSGDPSLRDGKRAVELAQQACEQAQGKSAGSLDTLAAAFAEAGDFVQAVATARRALSIARDAGATGLAGEIESRLAQYLQGQPHRDPLFGPRPPL